MVRFARVVWVWRFLSLFYFIFASIYKYQTLGCRTDAILTSHVQFLFQTDNIQNSKWNQITHESHACCISEEKKRAWTLIESEGKRYVKFMACIPAYIIRCFKGWFIKATGNHLLLLRKCILSLDTNRVIIRWLRSWR